MGGADKLSKVESRISLVQQVAHGGGSILTYFGLWPYIIAAGVAVFAALYRVLDWIGQYGWAGWFLLALASIVVVALVAGTVFSALARYEAYRRTISVQTPESAGPGQDLASAFEAATGVGQIKAQLDEFEHHTRGALNSIQFKMDIYNKTAQRVDDSFAGLRLLRLADKSNQDLDRARAFMESIRAGKWDSWDSWRQAKQTIEGYINSYSNSMKRFFEPGMDIYKVHPDDLSPKAAEAENIQFPNDMVRHDYLVLARYLLNARMIHMRLVTRFNRRIVSDSVAF